MSAVHLALLNPNTDRGHTAAMTAVARDVLPADAQLTPYTAERGPASIESAVDAAVAAAEVVAMLERAPDHDAYLIACFGDPGLDAARELTSAPVVGVGEAALLAATLVGRRFAIVTTLERGVPELWDMVHARGLGPRCAGVLPLAIPVAEQGAEHVETTAAIVAAGRRAVEELGADVLVLACGAMAEVARAIGEELRVPACDGVAFGALAAHGLVRAGLSTSKAGAYAWPEAIPYLAMAEPRRRQPV